MRENSLPKILSLLAFVIVVPTLGQPKVRVGEEKLELKTYVKGKPDLNPRFYEGLGHQGVQKHAYPYPMDDVLTDSSTTRSYKVIYLENEYMKISVVPELGGRIFSAYDKISNYDFIYRQGVIKPSLIGMVGSWMSGAIAWGFPHHHGPLTMAPFDYVIRENPDGSKTVWVAALDLRHRMRMMLGITVYPGRSCIEVSTVLDNRTPFANSMLFWANPSVKADSSYRIYFDPSVTWVTQHQKREHLSWPVGDDWYGRTDYRGVDVSWWKNVKRPVSFFSWNPQGDYFGGYSHDRQAGVAYIGNHHILPGMKIWAHGGNPEGDAWRDLLTDSSGHYVELMAGAYTDNQPDYSWMQPYEVKRFNQYWFPLSKIGGLKYANIEGALNLEVDSTRKALIRVNTTRRHTGAKIVLEAGGKKLLERTATLSPAQPFVAEAPVPAGIKETGLKISVISSAGEPLLTYQPPPKPNTPRPEVYQAPGDPKQIASVEELYLTGVRLDQFYNAVIDPLPYFQEALRRDSGNSDVNTYLGILSCKKMIWKEAERRLQTAVNRISSNYTRPRKCEALYYLGIALRAQGREKEAYDALYRATWDQAWHSAAYGQLAEMDLVKGDYTQALEHLERALATNAVSIKLRTQRAVALRKLGRFPAAEAALTAITQNDPLDAFSRNELYHVRKRLKAAVKPLLSELMTLMGDHVESHLELAADYSDMGLFEEAADVLMRISARSQYPMVFYCLGYFFHQRGEEQKALDYLRQAAAKPFSYCFPFRNQEREALEYARSVHPGDAKAGYYLGCLLYPNDPGRAMEEWQGSLALDSSFSYTWRNLAWGHRWFKRNTAEAIAHLEKAIALNNQDARFFYELDVLYEESRAPIAKRLALFSGNEAVIARRDDALARMAQVHLEAGQYDQSIEVFSKHHFNYWEGVNTAIGLYQDALVMRGILRLRNRDFEGALSDFTATYAYPRNLDMGRPLLSPRFCQLYYYTGLAQEALGRKDEATRSFEKAANEPADNTIYLYYQGLALKKLAKSKEAGACLAKLEQFATSGKSSGADAQFSIRGGNEADQQADRHYRIGLYKLGLEKRRGAKEQLDQAVQLNPFHRWAVFMLNEEFSTVKPAK